MANARIKGISNVAVSVEITGDVVEFSVLTLEGGLKSLGAGTKVDVEEVEKSVEVMGHLGRFNFGTIYGDLDLREDAEITLDKLYETLTVAPDVDIRINDATLFGDVNLGAKSHLALSNVKISLNNIDVRIQGALNGESLLLENMQMTDLGHIATFSVNELSIKGFLDGASSLIIEV